MEAPHDSWKPISSLTDRKILHVGYFSSSPSDHGRL
jgi:hypothetical protein